MLVKCIAACTHLSSTVYELYSEILIGNCNFFLPLAFSAPVWNSHWNSGKKFDSQKTRIMGLLGSEDSLTIGWAISTQYQRVTDRRTDRQTSSLYINNVRMHDWLTLKTVCALCRIPDVIWACIFMWLAFFALTHYWYKFIFSRSRSPLRADVSAITINVPSSMHQRLLFTASIFSCCQNEQSPWLAFDITVSDVYISWETGLRCR